ncbi:MAG: histidine--tRNA ligase [Bacteroidia bacterium]|nr:MAG: histidine--tRNA ligase [Bacteroidia bacterium]
MKAQNARGTRDFSPVEVKKRSYIINTIRKYFELYGFLPIETPAIENLSTLTGKYGEEGDQLLFKILNSRLHESKEKDKLRVEFEKMLEKPYNSELITERALRYDLTVPFARYVSQYRHTITFPFKRYQIQPVWRADRPQKGRYREFVQCDADVVGTDSVLMEVELISLINDAFSELRLPVVLKFNHRKILSGIINYAECEHLANEIIVWIDKIEKIGVEEVKKGISSLGVEEDKLERLFECLLVKGNSFEKVNQLKRIENRDIHKAIEDIEKVLNVVDEKDLNIEIEWDIKLARGLNYYTGLIFEAKAQAGSLTASILGGGRYDDLTSIFDLPGVSGVGISFGIDRIYDVMDELKLFPEEFNSLSPADVLIVYFEEKKEVLSYIFKLARMLRKENIRVEIYHKAEKMKKMMEYANKKQFKYVVIVGEDEMKQNKVSLKLMENGEQFILKIGEVIEYLNRSFQMQ